MSHYVNEDAGEDLQRALAEEALVDGLDDLAEAVRMVGAVMEQAVLRSPSGGTSGTAILPDPPISERLNVTLTADVAQELGATGHPAAGCLASNTLMSVLATDMFNGYLLVRDPQRTWKMLIPLSSVKLFSSATTTD